MFLWLMYMYWSGLWETCSETHKVPLSIQGIHLLKARSL